MRNFNRVTVCDYPGISTYFPPQTKADITGNFLDRPTDGLKKRSFGSRDFNSVRSHSESCGFSLLLGGNISGQHESYLGFVARCRFLEPGVEVGDLGFNHPHR